MNEYDKDKHIDTLEATNEALASKLAYLNKRKMTRNDEASLKWRGRCYYYKRKCELLTEFLNKHGLEAPLLVQMKG